MSSMEIRSAQSHDGNEDPNHYVATAAIETPKSASVMEGLAQFDRADNVALMPDKSLTPTRLSIPKSPRKTTDVREQTHVGVPSFEYKSESLERVNLNDEEQSRGHTGAAEPQHALNASNDSAGHYVPESLSSFVKQAENTLEVTTQEEFWSNSPRRAMNTDPATALSPDTVLGDRAPAEDVIDLRFDTNLLSKHDAAANAEVSIAGKEAAETEDALLSPDLATPPPNPHYDLGPGTAKRMALEETKDKTPSSCDSSTLPVLGAPSAPPGAGGLIDDCEVEVTGETVPASGSIQEPRETSRRRNSNESVDSGADKVQMKSDIGHVSTSDGAVSISFDGKERKGEPSPPRPLPVDYTLRRSSIPEPSPNRTPSTRNTGSSSRTRSDHHSDDHLEPPDLGGSSRKPQALSGLSRLLSPTAASAAHSRTVPGDRRKNVEADVNTPRDKPGEHIRRESKRQGDNPPNTSRPITMSPDEGLARARARVRIRKEQERSLGGKENAINKETKPKSAKKITRPITVPQGPNLSTSKRPLRTSAISQDEKNKPQVSRIEQPRTMTVPRAPRFATDRRAGMRSAAHNIGSRPDDQSESSGITSYSVASNSVAPLTVSSRMQRSGLSLRGDDASLASSSTKGTRRSVTVPQAPKFALDAKYGDKAAERRLLRERDDRSIRSTSSRSIATTSTLSTRRSVTVPQAPKFTLDLKYGDKTSPVRKANPSSLAESSNDFIHSLRSDTTEQNSSWQNRGVTVPVAPKFHSSIRRALPKSREELELEEMESFKFKARPMPTPSDDTSTRSQTSSKSPQRKLTVPVAPKFHTSTQRGLPKSSEERDLEILQQYTKKADRRRKTTVPQAPRFHVSSARPLPKSREEEEIEEMESYKFKARPMPTLSDETSTRSQSSSKSSQRKLTVPIAPKFHTSPNGRNRRKTTKSTLELEQEQMTKPFKARPMPTFSHENRRPASNLPRSSQAHSLSAGKC